jgi:hypothetical protein
VKAIHIGVEMVNARHPDHGAIWGWLSANGIDPMWVRVPSTVKVYDDAIVTEEILHEGDGTLRRNHLGLVLQSPVRYECTPTPIPTFEVAEVLDGDH